jgi:hypothetical protein
MRHVWPVLLFAVMAALHRATGAALAVEPDVGAPDITPAE